MASANDVLSTLAGVNTLALEDAEAANGASLGISTTSPIGSTFAGTTGAPATGSILIIVVLAIVAYFLVEDSKRRR